MQDAYTVSDPFPHASGFDPGRLPPGTGLGDDAINYIRNSVKITMDAYDGTMHFYVADPADPIIRAYQGIFPTLFEPLDGLPADLRSHLRVPEELFNVQTRVFGRTTSPNPSSSSGRTTCGRCRPADGDQTLPSEAYYVDHADAGRDGVEFLLLQPMVPPNRPNMIAWVAARNDGDSTASRVYRFPADTTVFGPAQIEARIDQDPIISPQVTLWNQSGSKVIRGNLIVVPLGDSLIYLQPVYLQSTSSSFPEFRRIVVASPRRSSGPRPSARRSASLAAGRRSARPGADADADAGPTPRPARRRRRPEPTPAPTRGRPCRPTLRASSTTRTPHFGLAQDALRDGDFARYGVEIALVQAALERLESSPGAGPGPGMASPAP